MMHPLRFLAVVFCFFTTLALRVVADEPFFFIQLSDPQFGMFNNNQGFTQETANLSFAAAAINRLKPAFVVVTGDLVNRAGDPAQIAEYRRVLALIDPEIPVYSVAGNHDVENAPTPESITRYSAEFGSDHYSFRQGGFVGIVLNSTLIHSPQNAAELLEAQKQWFVSELEKAQVSNPKHIVVFQHHPWCLNSLMEPSQYFNIPIQARSRYLELFRQYGVKYCFSGHYHRNAIVREGGLELVTSGAVGKPMGKDASGLRVVIVRDDGVEHRYFHFGEVPSVIDVNLPLGEPAK